MVHFFSVSIYDHDRLVSETRYYFGDCFLKSRRLEISYPGECDAGEIRKKLETVSLTATPRKVQVKRRANYQRKQKEIVKA